MRFTAVALRTMSTYLAQHSQLYLYQAYARAWSTAQRRAIALPSRQWWIPDGLLVGLDVTQYVANHGRLCGGLSLAHGALCRIPVNKIPYEQSLATAAVSQQRLDPFLYNPRAKTTSGGKVSIGVAADGRRYVAETDVSVAKLVGGICAK